MKKYGKTTEEINAKAGAAFLIELEGVPTAGYQWAVTGEEPGVEVRKEPSPEPPTAIGGSTMSRYRVNPTEPGDYELHLKYGRSWESAPLEEHIVKLHIS